VSPFSQREKGVSGMRERLRVDLSWTEQTLSCNKLPQHEGKKPGYQLAKHRDARGKDGWEIRAELAPALPLIHASVQVAGVSP
jgi:hypothetical protein